MKARMFLNILAVFVSIVAATQAQSIPQLFFTAENTRVQIGEDIVLRCRVDSLGGRFVSWGKEKPSHGAYQMATNYFPEPHYKDISRYNFSYSENDIGGYDFHFHVRGAQVEDSGNYSCSVPGSGVKDILEVNVIEEPQVIELYIDDGQGMMKMEDGSIVEMDDAGMRDITCIVKGANPAPEVRITVGEDDFTYSKDFTSTVDIIRNTTEHHGLDLISTVVTLVAKSFNMDFKYNKKLVTCRAAVDGGYTTLTKSFGIKFKGYKPVLDCYNSSTLMTYVTAEKVELKCRVQSSPPPYELLFYWYLRDNAWENTVLLQPGEVDGHYSTEVIDAGEDRIMKLKIDRIFPQMFRSYYFVAVNDFGRTEEVLTLEEDPSKAEVSGNGSPQVVFSAVLLLAASLVHLW